MGRDQSNSGDATTMTDDVFDYLISLISSCNLIATRKEFYVEKYDITKDKPSFNIVPKMGDLYLTYRDPNVFEVDVVGKIEDRLLYKMMSKVPEDQPYFSYEQEENLIRVLEMNNL